MFDIGWGELVVIGVVALIAIGPKELPTVLRTVGQWTGKLRRMAGEFQGQFQEAMREAEIADLKKQFDDAASAATNFDPLAETRKEIASTFDTKPAETMPADSAAPATPATSEAVPLPGPTEPVAEPLPLDKALVAEPALEHASEPAKPKEAGA